MHSDMEHVLPFHILESLLPLVFTKELIWGVVQVIHKSHLHTCSNLDIRKTLIPVDEGIREPIPHVGKNFGAL